MTPSYYVVLAAALFTIGAVGVLVRRNAIVLFMCVELMLNAGEPGAGHLRADQRHAGRPGHRVLRDGGRGRRGRRRPRDHHVDLPYSALGERR